MDSLECEVPYTTVGLALSNIDCGVRLRVMGIPKFYRWISERYPCLSQVIAQQQIPDFDNLYLDMNGIIHSCTHPNDDDPHFRLSEEAMFSDIFHYIEVLFRIIKPQKVFFMAVDGVAPRAKMNQQRGRRFRSAREAQSVMDKATSRGQVLPTEERFDSNCITPGTEFMWKLHKQLKYFVHQKTTNDPLWQQVTVILSGQDIPGEGEHKIMEYIRYQKTRSDYDPSTRHCLYGLDADLIMLGLVSHEPYFALLREEVKFGRKASKSSGPDCTTFHLLHISLLREYIDMEFSVVKEKLPFAYDLERIIDDWVLMGFLVGNDFIPHLPNFHIHQDTLAYIYSKYQEVLPTLTGYINDGGNLDLTRFEIFLQSLSSFDTDYLSGQIGDLRWFQAKTGKKRDNASEDPAVLEKLMRDLGVHDLESFFDSDDDEEEQIDGGMLTEIAQFKEGYYKEKFGFANIDKDVLSELSTCYVVAIMWILRYYYTGVPSWSWFYPYHYAPFVSDLKSFASINVNFDLGVPFKPFQQLLAVLPPASKKLLPPAYQPLMVNEQSSPIIDFYPLDFSLDLNGKRQEWEAVVLIPFIDEERLLKAMEPQESKLSTEEVQRNAAGTTLIMKYNGEMKPYNFSSSLVGKFPDIKCQTKCDEFEAGHYGPVDNGGAVAKDPAAMDTATTRWLFKGFPSFTHKTFETRLQQCGVQVFQVASRVYNMCVILTPPNDDTPLNLKTIADDLVGRTCYVDWPFLVEALVVSVSDAEGKIYSDHPLQVRQHNDKESKQWQEYCSDITHQYSHRRGITIGEIKVLIEAKKLVGTRYVSVKTGEKGVLHLEKQWSSGSSYYAYQNVVMEVTPQDAGSQQLPLNTVYTKGLQCVLLAPSYYGSLADVVSVDMETDRVHVRAKPHIDIDLSTIYGNWELAEKYYTSQEVCHKLRVSNLVLSRISSSCSCEETKGGRRRDIGLCFKYSKRQLELPGYCRHYEGMWLYSEAALNILKSYMKKFPNMFQLLEKNSSQNMYTEEHLFPASASSDETLIGAEEWVKALPTHGLQPIKCGSHSLDAPQVTAIERLVAEQLKDVTKTIKMKVKPWLLYKPTTAQSGVLVDQQATHELLDRVMNVSLYHPMKFGLSGTITGIRSSEDGTDQQYEIVFDESFLGGHTWRCSAGRAYCLNASSFVNISYGRRLDAKKKGGRHLHSNQWLPQATFHNFQPAEQVDYGFSHKTPDRANKSSSEKPPRQNRKQLYKSPDKAEVRLLRRPSDKSTTPTNNSRNNSVTSAVTTGTPSSGQTSVSTTAHATQFTPSVAAVFAAAAAAKIESPPLQKRITPTSTLGTPTAHISTTPTCKAATPTCKAATLTCKAATPTCKSATPTYSKSTPTQGLSPPVQALFSGVQPRPPMYGQGYYPSPPHNFLPMGAGTPPNYWLPRSPMMFNPASRHPNGPQVNPVAELQHVATSYGFPPVKVATIHNDPQGLYTGVVELPGLGVYRGTPSTDEYMAKCSAAAVALAMLRQPLLPGPIGYSPPFLHHPLQHFAHPQAPLMPPVSSVQPSFIPLQVQKKKFTADTTTYTASPPQRTTPQKSPSLSASHDLPSKSHDVLTTQTNSNNSHSKTISDTAPVGLLPSQPVPTHKA
ncbi:5'-3' exoribonuclease 1-like [Dysidea avara]|uniref:5'-3' exoribonuclease 1-like n=1 Tax=Dysidea avara TaxID=196820 RepID=UPI003326C188